MLLAPFLQHNLVQGPEVVRVIQVEATTTAPRKLMRESQHTVHRLTQQWRHELRSPETGPTLDAQVAGKRRADGPGRQ
ncbi:hypothetical protein GCM10010404_83180 [Nonomuraea africana]|uniref:Uncharacterized protein n=1 Tax=Nonomuraea africana TaxID=46171 RepID=A0ABR9K7V0_9ACTN|nr:hypothetical protein [Nonomuraea africana]